MFKNYFKAAFRIHVKNKLYSFINFIGLSVSLMMCFLVFLFVQDEFSYDNFHKSGDELFLFHAIKYKADNPQMEAGFWDVEPLKDVQKSYTTNLPFLNEIKSRVPEVENIILVEYSGIETLKSGKKSRETAHYVDADFFDHFSFDFIQGDGEVALDDQSSAVITTEFAMKHYGTTDVVGKDLVTNGEPNKIYIVTGVIDLPHNTMFNFNVVLRVENSYYYKEHADDWNYFAISAFFKLKDPSQIATVNTKVRDIWLERNNAETLDGQRKRLKLSADNPVQEYGLKNVSDVYLDPTIRYYKSSSPLYSYILIAISAVILIIASINYLSISIASSASRRVEIAVRKVVGANVSQLKFQFYIEAIALTLLSVIGGFTLMQGFLPKFNDFASKSLQPSVSENIMLLGYGLLFGLLISIIAGGYPAQVLSRFKVISGLKGQTSSRVSPALIKGMMIFQFTLCLVFISVTLVMQKQFKYINQKDLGFDKDQVVMVGGLWGKSHLVKQVLEKSSAVEHAGNSNGIFIGGSGFGITVLNGVEHRIRRVGVDEDFLQTLDIQFVDRQGFPAPKEGELVVGKNYVNETYFDLLEADTAMFKSMNSYIGGVVKDFHFESLQTAMYPISFDLRESSNLSSLFVKLKGGNVDQGIADVKAAYEEVVGEPLAEVRFMEDFLANRYKDSRRWQHIIQSSTTIGILIACIGLFGLTGINMSNRIKEISIRKVLGADFGEIAYLLNRQTLMLIIVSAIISIPIAYQLMSSWLDGFAYHVDISPELFMIAMLVLLFIALGTVLFHSIKSVRTNPAQVLRND
ncbi:ABC transporter permease [Roseivirga misakiensis]|uniref:ABC transporter permease n=1 Tax=Roseivirga misakiensis TaxID=1563681 RepID=A0A1E5SZP6_9BACT|nr:ABC transporter permease [Roseivirga misakiensis]OEK04517.1 hypothetical protein BFP71_13700 [Roseivirga misakiensis]